MERYTGNDGLAESDLESARALMPAFLGLEPDDPHIETAIHRLEDFVRSIPEPEGREVVKQLFLVLQVTSYAKYFKPPYRLSSSQLESFVEMLFDRKRTGMDRFIDLLTAIAPGRNPSIRDLAKSIREMLSLAYYTNPETDHFTGYTSLWNREDIWSRPDVDRSRMPPRPGPFVDADRVVARHNLGHPYDPAKLFASDRPGKKVAVIGSGAGGAVVAYHLARAGYDVAIFDSGPRFRPREYPLDALEGMSLLFEQGLMTTSRNVDLHLLRGRVVGGGTVLTSGMSIQMWSSTLQRWRANGMPIDADAMWTAFDTVKKTIALDTLAEDVRTSPGELWRQGAERLNQIAEKTIYDFEVPVVNVMSKPGQHPRLHEIEDLVGTHCLGCGLCNYGCHFGHKMSMDLTYLPDAEKHGAKIHPNLPIERLECERDDRGRVKVTHLVLGRGYEARVPVDHVVVAAGAVGSPALLMRSEKKSRALESLPSFRGDPEKRPVGNYLGFNYGTAVIARWAEPPAKPGDMGIQINYVGRQAGDETFVLENAFIPPGLVANVVPGVGRDHRDWMRRYKSLAMAVNTIGSPMKGRIHPDREVDYRIREGEDLEEMDTIHESIAMVVRQYLAAGAERVGLAGIRTHEDAPNWFDQGDAGLTERQIVSKLRAMVPSVEYLMISSAHPQGGLGMNTDPFRGAVDEDFRVHGTDNLFVADASLIPETIVVNPQWTVMALGEVAGPRIHACIQRS